MLWLLVVCLGAATSPSAAKRCCRSAWLSLDVTAVSRAQCTGQHYPDSESEIKDIMNSEHRTIPTTCHIHGCRGFCNLRVSKCENEIILNPHVDGSCVLGLDRTAASQLFDILGEWLG